MQKITFEDLPSTNTPINATNLNTIQTNVENAINSVVESGSNANGSWVKYNDGTMICWNRVIVTNQAIANAYVGLYQGTRTFTFPQTFYATPTGICSEFRYSTGASWGTISGITTTSIACRGIDTVSRSTGEDCAIGWVAIGRWKE